MIFFYWKFYSVLVFLLYMYLFYSTAVCVYERLFWSNTWRKRNGRIIVSVWDDKRYLLVIVKCQMSWSFLFVTNYLLFTKYKMLYDNSQKTSMDCMIILWNDCFGGRKVLSVSLFSDIFVTEIWDFKCRKKQRENIVLLIVYLLLLEFDLLLPYSDWGGFKRP